MVYAGDGKFRYQEDLLNMVHVLDDLKAERLATGGGVRDAARRAEPGLLPPELIRVAAERIARAPRRRELVDRVRRDRDRPAVRPQLVRGAADLAEPVGADASAGTARPRPDRPPPRPSRREFGSNVPSPSQPSPAAPVVGTVTGAPVRLTMVTAPGPASSARGSTISTHAATARIAGAIQASEIRRDPRGRTVGGGRGHAIPPVRITSGAFGAPEARARRSAWVASTGASSESTST